MLLVTGGTSLAASGRRGALLEGLAVAGVAIAGEIAVTDEPSLEVVDGVVDDHRGVGVDVVLAVGGGSALDAGKAIAAMLGPGAGSTVADHLEGLPGFRPYEGVPLPFVAVPTTAGTGSEATRNAVISRRGPDGWKRSIRHERMVAVDAVVDPDLLAGAAPVQIAANGMDALTQLLEAYTSTKAGPLTDALALDGLAAARDSLLAWHGDPEGSGAPAARSGMAYAALLSGICLAHAGLGGVHGLASPLGAQLPIPHGVACGTTLAGIVGANVRALETREPGAPALTRYAVLGRLLARLPEAAPDEEARAALVEVLARLGLGARDPRLACVRTDRGRHPRHRGGCPRQLDADEPGRAHGRGAGGGPGGRALGGGARPRFRSGAPPAADGPYPTPHDQGA